MSGSIFAILIIGGILTAILLVVSIGTYEDSKSKYNQFPDYICVRSSNSFPDGKAPFILFQMSFPSWWRLFELDPTSFVFVNDKGMAVSKDRSTENNYAIVRPVYYDEKKDQFLMVKFVGWDYFSYYSHEPGIRAIISSLYEKQLTTAMVGEIREKVEKLAEEVNQNIQTTLDLQKDIILRLESEQGKVQE